MRGGSDIYTSGWRTSSATDPRQRPLPGDSVLDKFIMAVTGTLLAFYVVVHLFGNLKIFLGAGQLDAYADWLRGVGSPLLPRMWVVWGFRMVLSAAFVGHVWAAWRVVRRNRLASGHGARAAAAAHTSVRRYAASTMRMSGVIIGSFVVFHLLDLTMGTANPGFEHGAVERNVVASLNRWPVAIAYSFATLALGTHLVHGTWSLFTSLGFYGRRVDRIRRVAATAIPMFVVVGNLAIPVAVLVGWVS